MKKSKKAEKKVPKAPKTLLQLFLLILISFIKGIPKLIKKSIIKVAIIFVVIILINTYLLVVKNEGFAPMMGNKWLDITALQGNIGWATAFWTFGMFFITVVFGRIKEDGIKKFLKEVFSSPVFFIKKMKESGTEGLPTLLMTTAIILFITLLIKNKGTMLLYAVIAFFSFTKRENSFLVYFFALLRSDLNKLLRKHTKINQSTLYIMSASVMVAFLIAFIIKNPIFISLLGIAFIGTTFFYKSKHQAVKTMIFIFTFIATNYIYYKITGTVYADDGGWQESGATLSGWIGSQGAGTALGMGIPPATGGALGVVSGLIYSDMDSNIFVPDNNIFEDIIADEEANEIIEEIDEIGEEISEDIEDIISGIEDVIIEGTTATEDFVEGAVEDLSDMTASSNTITTPLAPSNGGEILDTQVDYSNILGNLLGVNDTKGQITSLIESSEDFSSYMQDMVKNSDVFDYVSDIFEGNSKEKLNWLKNNFEKIKKSKIDGYADALKGGLTFLGMGLDAYENVNNGDELAVAVSKSAATNASVFLAGEALEAVSSKSASSLALWELGNHVLFGGSKAADIGSPVKLIKGGMNWALDAAGGMDPKELATRMDRGDYGENIKNIYYGTDMVKDFVDDPGSFYEEVGDFTVAGGQGWKDMNKTADDIFKLPDNVRATTADLYSTNALNRVWNNPLDSTRRVATDAAHLATKTAIKVGEGWAYIGEGLGTGSVWAENKVASSYNYIKSFF